MTKTKRRKRKTARRDRRRRARERKWAAEPHSPLPDIVEEMEELYAQARVRRELGANFERLMELAAGDEEGIP